MIPVGWNALNHQVAFISDTTGFASKMNEFVQTLISLGEAGCQLLLMPPLDGVLVLCLGMINIPAVALGMFSGGVVMKRYRLGIMGAAKFAFATSLLGYFLSLFFLAMGCENSKVAGITVSYSG